MADGFREEGVVIVICPECSSEKTEVLETRKADGGKVDRRRHRCGGCGVRWTSRSFVELGSISHATGSVVDNENGATGSVETGPPHTTRSAAPTTGSVGGVGGALSSESRSGTDPDPVTDLPLKASKKLIPRDGCELRPGLVTGTELCRLFGSIRARDLGGLQWQSVKTAGGSATTMAEAINTDPSLREDVAPTMALLFKRARTGAAGARSADIVREASFAFGAWLSQWTSLREELHGLTPVIPVAARPRPVGEKAWQTADKVAEEQRGSERAQRRIAQANLDRILEGADEKAVG